MWVGVVVVACGKQRVSSLLTVLTKWNGSYSWAGYTIATYYRMTLGRYFVYLGIAFAAVGAGAVAGASATTTRLDKN
ncbi:hypothetical protein M0802_005443 [Mischocyttarus mexicanus]|nr:hypothetical protein M0802_005443 [Mischocyttarus mexicanus]